MTGYGKRGKPKTGFPLFPQPLEIAAAIPTLPPPRLRRAWLSLRTRQTKTGTMMHNTTTQVGQIKWSKWAKPE